MKTAAITACLTATITSLVVGNVQKQPWDRTVHATRFELKDDRGKTVAVLGTEEGMVQFIIGTRTRAIQLAVYDQLVPGETPVAYFSLSDGQFISPNPGWLQGVRTIRGNSLEKTWQQLHRTLDYFKTQFDEQATPATGVPDGDVRYPDIDDGLALEPKCPYCEYAALCGVQWIERGEDEHQRRQRLSRLG